MPHRAPILRPTRLAAALLAAWCMPALSAPLAPTVVAGSASVTQAGSTTTIVNAPGTIINWHSFSIDTPETVVFQQQSAASSVLNRSLSNDPTRLLGSLQSNGQVFLVTPAGLYIGPQARIDTAGFVASTLALGDQDFLAGRLNFQTQAGAGTIVNDGRITAASGGQIYLVAPSIDNRGVLSAADGEILLAAGQSVELVDTGTPGVRVNLSAGGGEVVNVGEVVAESGRIGLAGVLVRNDGRISASSVVHDGGRIFLRADRRVEQGAGGQLSADGTRGGQVELESGATTRVDGELSARGTQGPGGQIDLLGEQVGLVGDARVDVSGANGGGSIRVGGDFQGSNPAIRNAAFTYVGPRTQLRADAATRGDGGRVIVWSDQTTRAYGEISARGGATGGDGGFVEISGKQFLDYAARVDTRAPNGRTGTLLLDPADVFIAENNPSADAMTGPVFDNPLSSADFSLSWLGANGILAQLGTSNVTITTSGIGTSSTGDISFAAAGNYTWSGGNALTLLAHDDIIINGTLGNTGGALTLVAGWNGNLAAPGIAAAPPSGSINGSGGAVLANTLKASAFGDIALTNSSNNIQHFSGDSSGGNVILKTTADIGLGLVKATPTTGIVNLIAGGKILDDNGSGTTNIRADSTTLTSTGGAGSPSFIAVSADVDATTSITANAGGGFGGVRIWNTGGAEPSSVLNLTDGATTRGLMEYRGVGAVNVGANFSGGASLTVDTPDALNVIGAVSAPVVRLHGGTTLTVNTSSSLSATGLIELAGGAQVVVATGGSVSGAGGVDIAAPTVDLQGSLNASGGAIRVKGGNIQTSNAGINGQAVFLDSLSALKLSNSTVTATVGDIMLNADTGITVTQSSVASSSGNVKIATGGDVRVLDTTTISAKQDIAIHLDGSASTLYLNDVATLSPARLISRIGGALPGGTFVDFAARSAGGVVIDGVESTTTLATGSGFFVGAASLPATLADGLTINYAGGTTNAVTTTLAGAIATATGSGDPTGGTTGDTALPSTVSSDAPATGGTTTDAGTPAGEDDATQDDASGDAPSDPSANEGPAHDGSNGKPGQCT